MAGRRSFYTEENVETILEEIRRSGNEKNATKLVGVGYSTYHYWKRDKPGFAAAVEDALKTFHTTKHETAKEEIELAEEYLRKTLKGENWQFEYVEKQVKNDEGEMVTVAMEIRKRQIIPPTWYLEKLLTDNRVPKEFKVTIGVATHEERSEEQIELDMGQWVDVQDQFNDFDRDQEED